ncbi:hypothetical protein [Saccharothrix deserti]|uniref:hypothetical protein n=1 Tax=Saccharothrix deserti TaxID=2593674 RepID=UPI00131AA8BE|nr:hypothetical protein [Saccharothrix deserti]
MRYALVVVALLATACSSTQSTTAPAASAPGTSTTSTTTTTRSVDPELGPRRLKAAALPVDALTAYGADQPKDDKYGIWNVTDLCGGVRDPGKYTSYYRSWSSDRIAAFNYVHRFEDTTAGEVLSWVADRARTCPSYTHADGSTRVVQADIELPRNPILAGTFGYCEQLYSDTHLCAAVMSRDNLMSVFAVAGRGNRDDVRAQLLEVLPKAVDSLLKA